MEKDVDQKKFVGHLRCMNRFMIFCDQLVQDLFPQISKSEMKELERNACNQVWDNYIVKSCRNVSKW